MSNVPLPEPHHQSAANFNAPDEPFYTADQMHAHAAAVSAAKDAEIAQLRAELIKSLADNAALRADAIDRQNNVVAPLRAEVAGLRETLAQKVVDQTMLTGLTVQDGGLTMGLQGGAAGLLVEMLAQQFKDGGGINYLQLSFTSSVCLPGEAFIVTVQKCAGKTPHQLRMDAETEAAALRAEVAGLREDAERWRWAVKRKNIVHWNDDYKPPFVVIRFHGDVTAQGHHKTLNEAVDAARKQKP